MTKYEDKIDYDAIMRDARAMRAQVMAETARSIINFFRKRPSGAPAKA